MKTYYLISLDDDHKPIHTMKMVSRDDVTADSLPDFYKAGCAKLVVARDIEDAQITKPQENVTCGDVSNMGVFPLFGYEICDKDFFAGTMKNNGGKVDDIWWMTDITDYSEDALQREIKRVEFINRAMNERALAQQQPVNEELLGAAKEYMAAVKALGEKSGYNHQTYFEAPILKAPPEIGKEAMERWQDLNDTGVNLSEAPRAEQKGGVTLPPRGTTYDIDEE